MRVTSEGQSQLLLQNLQATYSKVSKLQEQISSGHKVDLPSDDPVSLLQILQNNSDQAQLDTHLKTIQTASDVLQSRAAP